MPRRAARPARALAGCVAALLGAAHPVAAQNPPDTLRPFLTLDTRVTMRSLTFQRVGYAEVRLRGVDTARVVTRENLPRPAQAGVAYRDVRVYAHYRIGSPMLEGLLRDVLTDTTRTDPGAPPRAAPRD